jgi:hypothetical protein
MQNSKFKIQNSKLIDETRVGFVRRFQGLVLFWLRSLLGVNEEGKTKA